MRNFHLYPAIDIKNGHCVRLLRGDFKKETIYEYDPMKQVELFLKNGCKWVHIVDLNASIGQENNKKIILKIIKYFHKDIKIQLGGGIRSSQNIKFWIENGISRIVVGTLAYENPEIVNTLDNFFAKKIALAVDVKDGKIATHGWKSQLNLNPLDLINKLDKSIIDVIIYTDISRDGTLSGVNIDETLKFAKSLSIPVIASGGISKVDEIQKLFNLRDKGIAGAIVGKALYEKKFTVDDVKQIIYMQV